MRSLRRKLSLASLVLVLGTPGWTLRAQQTNLPAPTSTYPFAKGTLESLNSGARQFTLRIARATRNFEVTPRTYIFRGKDKITLDKLKIGEELRLSYYTNEFGQALVKRIKVYPPGATNDPARAIEVPN